MRISSVVSFFKDFANSPADCQAATRLHSRPPRICGDRSTGKHLWTERCHSSMGLGLSSKLPLMLDESKVVLTAVCSPSDPSRIIPWLGARRACRWHSSWRIRSWVSLGCREAACTFSMQEVAVVHQQRWILWCLYDQDPKTKAIRMSMKNCAEKLRPANIKRGVPPNTPLDALQQRTLRAINGSLNWFASQSRPDISAQTSISQQFDFEIPRFDTFVMPIIT